MSRPWPCYSDPLKGKKPITAGLEEIRQEMAITSGLDFNLWLGLTCAALSCTMAEMTSSSGTFTPMRFRYSRSSSSTSTLAEA